MLTAPVRRSLRTAPAHAFDAPVAGSGKTFLVDIANVIATGQEAGVIAQGSSEEETEKRIGACLLAGVPIIAIDNCERPLSGEVICQMLTQTQVKVRILGVSEAPTLASDAFVTVTGNNPVLAGDLTRRAVLCRLDPQCERPETRIFKNDAVGDTKAGRPELVAAALTVLRAYHVARKPWPDDKRHLGSFEEWSKLIRGALIWTGCADPVASMDKVRDADPLLSEFRDVVAQWQDIIGTDKATVADVVAIACAQDGAIFGGSYSFTHGEFREALLAGAGRGGAINTKALGKWFTCVKGRIEDGVRFEPAGEKKHAILWRLVRSTT